MTDTISVNDLNIIIQSENNVNKTINSLNSLTKDKNKELNNLINIYGDKLIKSLEILAETIKPYDLFFREYIVFENIMDMVGYTLKETESLSSDYMDFIKDVCSSFFNILHLKLDLFKEYDYKFSDEFKKAYERLYFSYRKYNSGFVRKFTNGIFVSDYDNPELMKEYCRLVYEGK